MQTLLIYLIVAALVMAAVFAIAWFVFGRGEELPPLEAGTTLTRLPRENILGDDVRDVRFSQEVRGYKQSEVDWVLEKLAREIDELRDSLADLNGGVTTATQLADRSEPGVVERPTAGGFRTSGTSAAYRPAAPRPSGTGTPRHAASTDMPSSQ